LHAQLSEESARYQNQIHALVVVLFPEFTQVIADPCLPSALAVLKAYPHAQAVAQAGVEVIARVLKAVPAAHFGRPTAEKLVAAAQASVGSGRALSERASSLRIICDQLEHTQANLQGLEKELEQLIATDPATKGLQQMPELGLQTVAVVRGSTERSGPLCPHGPGGGLRRHGYRDQGEWPVERQSQALQARQWLIAPNPLLGCLAE
jgi:transposase